MVLRGLRAHLNAVALALLDLLPVLPDNFRQFFTPFLKNKCL